MKCHYTYDPEVGKVLIPGCMGTAAFGIHRCTCASNKSFSQFEKEVYNKILEEKNQEITDLEKEIIRLNRVLKNLLKKNKKQHVKDQK